MIQNLENQQQNLNNKIIEIKKRVQLRTIILSGMLKGILLDKENSPTNKEKQLLLQGGEEMKYQGIKIIKNKTCSTWSARPTINGKQIYISAKTQQECYNKLKIAINKKSNTKSYIEQKTNKKQKNNLTFIEWFYKWKELYKSDIRKATEKEYFNSLKHLKTIHNLKIDNISSMTIQEQLNKIEAKRAKQKVYEFLKMVFEKAYTNEIISKNPMLVIDKPKYTRINGNALSSEDEPKLEKMLINDNADAFLICLYQGLRKGEVLALKSEDLDFNNNTISINNSLDFQNNIGETKNYSSKRIMPMFEKTKPILEKYKYKKGRLFKTSVQTFNTHFLKYSKKFNKHYTIHSLRHTFITRCQECGIPLHIIQKWVGHTKGSAVTMNVYTHTRNNAEAENIEIYNKKFN